MKRISGSTKRRDDLRMRIEEIIGLYKAGNTCLMIANRFSVSKRLIINLLAENNIPRRKAAPLKGRIPWNKGIKCPQTSGSRNGLWKGGITPFIIKIRRCYEYKQWVNTILKRDDYTCQICHKRGGDLQVDHYPTMFSDIISKEAIKSFEQALSCVRLWDLDNGRTLCKNCHRKTFKFKGNQFSKVLK